MTNQQKLKKLYALLDEIEAYARCIGKVGFDMECCAPEEGIERAGEDMALLGKRYYTLTHAKHYTQLLTELHADGEGLTAADSPQAKTGVSPAGARPPQPVTRSTPPLSSQRAPSAPAQASAARISSEGYILCKLLVPSASAAQNRKRCVMLLLGGGVTAPDRRRGMSSRSIVLTVRGRAARPVPPCRSPRPRSGRRRAAGSA